MGKASYICAVCSQDFTRKWSGKRHNQDLHFGTAEIVRVLDYIIGRLSGKYFQANPLEYRKRPRSSSRFTRDFTEPEENWDSLSESTQYLRGYKGSDPTRREKLDEIKALLSIRFPRTYEYILNTVSLQNDFWLNDYLKWLRSLSPT
jgi:hypothetical protein